MSDNLDTIRSAYAAFAQGDIPAVLGAMAPDVVWNEAEHFPYADGNPYVGPEAVAQGVFARLGSEWDSFGLEIEDLIDGGNNIVVLGRYKGKYAANGNELDAQFAHVWWLEEGKITRFQQYTDTVQARTVVGG